MTKISKECAIITIKDSSIPFVNFYKSAPKHNNLMLVDECFYICFNFARGILFFFYMLHSQIKILLTLQAEIVELDKCITATSSKVIEKGEELVRARKVESNMAAAVNSLTMCLPVLAAYAKLQKQLKDKRYYPALKTLEQLEHHDLPKVTNYRFSSQITQQIPQ